MKRLTLCFFGLIFSTPAWSALSLLSVNVLLASPDTYDGKSVCVEGTAGNIHESTSAKGNAYFTLTVGQNASALKVFSFGKSEMKNGQAVLACGRFHKENQVGEQTFHNELTACLVETPPGLFRPAIQAGRPPTFAGPVTRVLDGDTLDVFAQNHARRLRLEGVDCPEKRQAFGEQAKQFTTTQVLRKNVSVEVVEIDKYGRMVAWVRLADDRLLNEEIVRAGMGWWFRKYAPDNKTLERLESEARAANRGLWADKNPTAPWDFRRPRGEP